MQGQEDRSEGGYDFADFPKIGSGLVVLVGTLLGSADECRFSSQRQKTRKTIAEITELRKIFKKLNL